MPSFNPTVSIIIPTYNRSQYLAKAIDSVLKQTYKDFEIIVVDDGSTDNTQKVLDKYQKQIRYIYQTNTGCAAARNRGIELSKGKWIAFLDSDDEWMAEKLAIQMNDIQKNKYLCAHVCNAMLISNNNEDINYFGIRHFMSDSEYFKIVEKPFLNNLSIQFFLQCSVFKKDSLINAGLFDEYLRVSSDVDMFLRLAFEGPFGYNNSVLVKIFRRNEQAIALSRIVKPYDVNRLEYWIYFLSNILKKYELDKIERYFLKKNISGYIYLLAIEQALNNDTKEAKINFKKALDTHKSSKNIIKHILTLIPLNFGILLFKKWHMMNTGILRD